jgi:hypothetical protein
MHTQREHDNEAVRGVEVETEVPFNPGDVHKAMRLMPKAKAPGTSGLRNELVREAPMEVARIL